MNFNLFIIAALTLLLTACGSGKPDPDGTLEGLYQYISPSNVAGQPLRIGLKPIDNPNGPGTIGFINSGQRYELHNGCWTNMLFDPYGLRTRDVGPQGFDLNGVGYDGIPDIWNTINYLPVDEDIGYTSGLIIEIGISDIETGENFEMKYALTAEKLASGLNIESYFLNGADVLNGCDFYSVFYP